jgi:hypothetical protein
MMSMLEEFPNYLDRGLQPPEQIFGLLNAFHMVLKTMYEQGLITRVMSRM